jgi:hypothetical protein
MLANARIHRVRIRFLIYGASFPSPNARETEYFWLCEPCSGGNDSASDPRGNGGDESGLADALCNALMSHSTQ